ncbi:3327_t:CDS:2 [Scutellospora calospora]|uniref:3327_t:CDS:1 n=1 Tax=Scutellospora calospora TaxID=85575 RepID=A0ACA9KMS3_9GLOM|nr:3327_t:CDS:2 [Scutellospora calospora]
MNFSQQSLNQMFYWIYLLSSPLTSNMAESFNDFLAGYVSGVMGLIVGSPLDVLKVRLQTMQSDSPSNTLYKSSTLKNLMKMKQTEGFKSFFKGVGSPIIGLAFLNSILFTSYGSILRLFEKIDKSSQRIPSLAQVYVAGFGSGIACFIVSTPTELVKCRAQAVKQKDLTMTSSTTWNVFKDVIQTRGVRGLYQGGLITIIRDAPGYGVYFWTYEVLKRSMNVTSDNFDRSNGPKLLFSGGMAGVLSWASIYPLDVIKSRIQTQQQPLSKSIMNKTVTSSSVSSASYSGIIECATRSYRNEGISVFFKGITPTLVRALPVNAVTFYVYEIMIHWLNTFQN